MKDMDDAGSQIIEQLSWAHRLVDAADVPEDLRVAAFQHALGLSGELLQTGRSARTLPILRLPPGDTARDGDALARIGEHLQLPCDAVERIYQYRDGVVRLAPVRSLLPKLGSKAASMRDVALLVAVGRQLAGQEEETAFSTMRSECRNLGILDGPNFATEIGKLDMSISGSRNARFVRTHAHHHARATALIKSMVRRSRAPR